MKGCRGSGGTRSEVLGNDENSRDLAKKDLKRAISPWRHLLIYPFDLAVRTRRLGLDVVICGQGLLMVYIPDDLGFRKDSTRKELDSQHIPSHPKRWTTLIDGASMVSSMGTTHQHR